MCVTGYHTLAPVVVDDRSIYLGASDLLVADAVASRIMENQVDQFRTGPEDIDGHEVLGGGDGAHDLEPPVPGVAPLNEQVAIDGGPLARILPHDDRSRRRASQQTREGAGVGPTP